jgi:hypothetical protein
MWIRRAALPIVLGVLFGPGVASAAATTWQVTTTSDPTSGTSCPSASNCSLRQAISQAVDGDVINVPSGHYTLNGHELLINASITIAGAGASSTIVDGDGASRVIHVDTPGGLTESSATLSLKDLDVTGGSVTRSPANTNAGGAGIQNDSSGGLYLSRVVVTNNSFTASTVNTNEDDIGGAGIFSLSTVALTDSVITHNTLTIDGAQGDSGGAGVLVTSGDLIVAGSTISDNTATVTEGTGSFGENGGGGLYMAPGSNDLIVEDSTISGNTLTIPTTSTVDGDDDGGGGIFQQGVSILAHDSTLSQNNADLRGDGQAAGGGAIVDAGGGSAYTNTTFTGNTVELPPAVLDQGGGAIYYRDSGLSSLANDTFASNSVTATTLLLGEMGANLYDESTSILVADTILSAGSSPAGNCTQDQSAPGSVVSDGYNLYDDSANSCALHGTGDQLATSLALGSLAYNGGPADTIALKSGSPAINGGNPGGCNDAFGHALATDERGVARPQPAGGRCDVGAYEVAPPVATSGLAGAVGKSGATLQGTATNPDALPGTSFFQYGTSTTYGKTTSAQPLGTETTATMRAALTGLKPGTYHYRIVVANPDGTSYGADSTFVVAKQAKPAVLTGAALKITAHRATLTGELDGFGIATKYQFQFGKSRKYTAKTKLKSAGKKSKIVTVKVAVHGLKPNHKYHFRLVAISSTGRTNGSDAKFKTS